jgi:hypothetical protein
MTFILSHYITDGQVHSLLTSFHVALTGLVFVFLALIMLLN